MRKYIKPVQKIYSVTTTNATMLLAGSIEQEDGKTPATPGTMDTKQEKGSGIWDLY